MNIDGRVRLSVDMYAEVNHMLHEFLHTWHEML